MRKYLMLPCLFLFTFSFIFSAEVKLTDLQVKEKPAINSDIKITQNVYSLFSTKNLAWTTLAFLAATGLTAKEKDASDTHVALAGLTMISYGAFLNSYLTNSTYNSEDGGRNKYINGHPIQNGFISLPCLYCQLQVQLLRVNLTEVKIVLLVLLHYTNHQL